MPARVKLSDMLEALEMQGDETHAFVDRQTGKVLVLSDEELRAAEEGEPPSDYPEWQRENIEQASFVNADDGSRFVALPDRFEIHEWEMMRDFADTVEDDGLAESLHGVIQGRGALCRFKDLLLDGGLADPWYAFRDGRYRQIALDWCKEHGLELDTNA